MIRGNGDSFLMVPTKLILCVTISIHFIRCWSFASGYAIHHLLRRSLFYGSSRSPKCRKPKDHILIEVRTSLRRIAFLPHFSWSSLQIPERWFVIASSIGQTSACSCEKTMGLGKPSTRGVVDQSWGFGCHLISR